MSPTCDARPPADRRCGTCRHWRGAVASPGWRIVVNLGVCRFDPAPAVFTSDRTCSENDGRGCPVYEPRGAR